MRRRDTYFGGSTLHIPGRDFRSQEKAPPKALQRARVATDREQCGAGDEASRLYHALCKELRVLGEEAEAIDARFGASLDALIATRWRERLSEVVRLARLGGMGHLAKIAQSKMAALDEVQRHFEAARRWGAQCPQQYKHSDHIYFDMAGDHLFWRRR